MTIKVILFQLLLGLNTSEIPDIIYQDLEKPNRCWGDAFTIYLLGYI